MDDRELLELAAKAAGLKGEWGGLIKNGEDEIDCSDMYFVDNSEYGATWDPLADDGDALRLAISLNLIVDAAFENGIVCSTRGIKHQEFEEFKMGDKFMAARRAIVRAAAEIGRAM